VNTRFLPLEAGLWPLRLPSAASCAFLMSGLEVISYAVTRLYLDLVRGTYETAPLINPLFNYTGLILGVVAVTAHAISLWGVARHQQDVAPLSVRLGRCAIILFSVLGPIPVIAGSLDLWALLDASKWWKLVWIPSSLAYACLSWATRGGTDARQRWASRSLLLLAAFRALGALVLLTGFPSGHRPPWLTPLQVAFRAGAWSAVGIWLYKVRTVAMSDQHELRQ
jgi:hypothetical protein